MRSRPQAAMRDSTLKTCRRVAPYVCGGTLILLGITGLMIEIGEGAPTLGNFHGYALAGVLVGCGATTCVAIWRGSVVVFCPFVSRRRHLSLRLGIGDAHAEPAVGFSDCFLFHDSGIVRSGVLLSCMGPYSSPQAAERFRPQRRYVMTQEPTNCLRRTPRYRRCYMLITRGAARVSFVVPLVRFALTIMNRTKLALASYWALFVLAPLVTCFLLLGASAQAAGYCVPIFVVLCIIGEHGFRRWKRIWKVE
jgi:hypothetical protein